MGDRLTSTLTGEGQASIFVTVDHCSTEYRRHPRGTPGDPVRGARAAAPGLRACVGAFAEGVASGLKLRHDHGSQFVADDYQRELAFLGIASSPPSCASPRATAVSSGSSGP